MVEITNQYEFEWRHELLLIKLYYKPVLKQMRL